MEVNNLTLCNALFVEQSQVEQGEIDDIITALLYVQTRTHEKHVFLLLLSMRKKSLSYVIGITIFYLPFRLIAHTCERKKKRAATNYAFIVSR